MFVNSYFAIFSAFCKSLIIFCLRCSNSCCDSVPGFGVLSNAEACPSAGKGVSIAFVFLLFISFLLLSNRSSDRSGKNELLFGQLRDSNPPKAGPLGAIQLIIEKTESDVPERTLTITLD